MYFSKQTLNILRRCSGNSNPIVVTVLNKLNQEFKIEGYIPKAYSIMQGVRVPNLNVQADYINLRFGTERSSVISVAPPNNGSLLGLFVKEISTPDGIQYFEADKEEYETELVKNMRKIYSKYHDTEYHTTSSPYWNIIQVLLVKVVIYNGKEDVLVKGKEAIITHIGRGTNDNELCFQLRCGSERSNVSIPIKEIRKSLFILPDFTKNLY